MVAETTVGALFITVDIDAQQAVLAKASYPRNVYGLKRRCCYAD